MKYASSSYSPYAVASVHRRAALWALLLGGYLLVALVVTYPLVWGLGDAVAGIPGDSGFFLWCMDHFWTSVRAGKTPFLTDRILFPLGANLAASSCTPALSFFALPFLSHLILFGGLIALGSLVVAAVGTMLLVRALTHDDGAAAVAGLLYGASPTLLSLLWGSQLAEVAAAALLPFGVLFLVQFLQTGRVLPLLGLSTAGWIVVGTQIYTAVALLVMMVVVAMVLAPVRLTWKHCRRAALIGAVNVSLLWLILKFLMPPVDLSDIPRGGYGFTSRAVVNLVDLLVPSARNPVLGTLYVQWSFDTYNGDINSYFLGWSILALAIGGAIVSRRNPEIMALALAGAATLVLACGTAIRVGQFELLVAEWTPFDWLSRMPAFGLLDTPRRLVIGTALMVAVLAGVGIARLARWSGYRGVLFTAVLLAIAIEYGQIGTPVTPVPVPGVYKRLAAEPGTRTLLEMGGGLAASNNAFGLDWSTPSGHLMYWQTVHRKPRVGGYLARIQRSTDQWFRQTPILSDLFTMTQMGVGKWSGTIYPPEAIETFLRTFNLGYVIVPPYPRQEEYAAVLDTLLQGRIAQKDTVERYILYTLVDEGPARSD